MIRCALAILLGFAFFGLADGADEKKKMTITWHGQSFFVIESSKGTKIVTDPHLLEEYNPNQKTVKGDLILVSHPHDDHNQVRAVEPTKEKGKIEIIPGITEKGKKQDWAIVDKKFKDVHIRSVGTFHDTTQGMERGKNTVFVLDVDGVKIAFLGDLGHKLTEKQVKDIGPIDILFIPVGGVYTLNGADAKEVAKQLNPKQYIIPMHFGTEQFKDILTAEEFLEDEKKTNVERLRTNKYEIDLTKKPKEPKFILFKFVDPK